MVQNIGNTSNPRAQFLAATFSVSDLLDALKFAQIGVNLDSQSPAEHEDDTGSVTTEEVLDAVSTRSTTPIESEATAEAPPPNALTVSSTVTVVATAAAPMAVTNASTMPTTMVTSSPVVVAPTNQAPIIVAPPQALPGPWYVVTVGRVPGVYQGWHIVAPLVVGVSGNTYFRVNSHTLAQDIFAEAEASGGVRAIA